MEARGLASTIRDWLITILAVWAILIGTGMAFARWQPHLLAALLSLLLCTALLFAWGRWAPPGRGSPLPIFLLAGLLYILLTVALALSVPLDATEAVLWLAAGLSIGFQPSGGPHVPLEYYLVPMILNLFGPILVMGFLRLLARRDDAEQSHRQRDD